MKAYYDATNEQLIVDKPLSGSNYITTVSMPMSKLEGNKIKLRIIVDNAVLEVFGNDGEAPIVSTAYPGQHSGMSFYVVGSDVTVNDLVIYPMQSIWQEKLKFGDANDDGEITAEDLTMLRKYLIDKLDTEIADDMIFDVNVDAEINVKDLARFKKYFAGLIEKLGYIES